MAENNAQKLNDAQLFVLSENARNILAKFEERLEEEGLSDKKKEDVRIELIAKLTTLAFPESAEYYLNEAQSGKKEMEKAGMVAYYCLENVENMLGLQTDSCEVILQSFVSDDSISVLCAEYPAVIDYYYFNEPAKIVDSFKNRDAFHSFVFEMAPFDEEMGVWDDDVIKPRNSNHAIYCDGLHWVENQIDDIMTTCLYKIRSFVGLLNGNKVIRELPLSAFDRAVTADYSNSQTISLLGEELTVTEFVDKYLNEQGVLFYFVPKEASFESGWQKCRQSLMDDRRLFAIIDLPTHLPLQENHGNCSTLWVIKKGLNLDKVLFVDARNDVSQMDSTVDFQKVLEKLKGEDSSCYREVQYDDLNVNDFAADYYCSCPVPKDGERKVALRDLVDLYDTEIEDEAVGYFVLREHYTSDFDGCWIDYSLEEEKYLKPMQLWSCARRVPLKNDLCMARAKSDSDSMEGFEFARFGDVNEVLISYRPDFPDNSLFDDESEFEDCESFKGGSPKIYTYGDAFIFRNKWDERNHPRSGLKTDYLLMVLTSEDVLNQIENMKSLTKDDFLSLQIVVPNFEEQNRRLAEYRKTKRSEDLRTIKKNLQSYKDDVRMKKHALAQRLRVMKNWWQCLQKARKDGEGIVDDKAFVGDLHPKSVKDIYDHIEKEMNLLFKQVSSFNLGDQMQAELFDVNAFVQDYVKHHDPMFEYDCQFLDKPVNICFPKEALQIILDNIASNACAHGFKGRENGTNVIRLSLELKGYDLILTIQNNGKPMSSNMSSERVFTYGDTTEEGVDNHCGIGGFQIKDLMERFGSDVFLELNDESEFPVSYRLVFYDVQSVQ